MCSFGAILYNKRKNYHDYTLCNTIRLYYNFTTVQNTDWEALLPIHLNSPANQWLKMHSSVAKVAGREETVWELIWQFVHVTACHFSPSV